jgi:hypothetical protein
MGVLASPTVYMLRIGYLGAENRDDALWRGRLLFVAVTNSVDGCDVKFIPLRSLLPAEFACLEVGKNHGLHLRGDNIAIPGMVGRAGSCAENPRKCLTGNVVRFCDGIQVFALGVPCPHILFCFV